MDSSDHLNPKHSDASSYGALTRRRTDSHTLPPSSHLARPTRHHSERPALTRRLSGIDNPSASLNFGQLTQMRDGIAYGLGGYSSNLNYLLICLPLGIAASLLHYSPLYIFIFNFLAMIPLAMLLGKATEDIAEHTNETLGALVNVTFGNAVELIISIAALRASKLQLVQDTIAGSVLSNLLLVLGSAFFFGGLRYKEQEVLPAVSEANADLLSFAVFGISVPALFATSGSADLVAVERVSLATSIGLLVIYVMYLLFQLHTHADLYSALPEEGGGPVEPIDEEARMGTSLGNFGMDDEDESEQVASLPVAILILVFMVALVAVASELLVNSIDGFSQSVGLGQKFIAVVLLPVIGNAVEHMSAILVARHNKIDLSIGIACGSSVQIALFAAPLLVVISWMLGLPHLTLNFQLFETVCIAFTVFVVNATLRDSRTNWLEGAVLMMCYFIISTAFYYMG